ncbi:MAG: PilZ domain-containing protein [Spirochaetes bacterium]|nr:PilZ domain-containing protein [Spirochaetota bacterium]
MSSVISRIEKEFIFKFLIQNKINFEIKSGKNSTFANLLEYNINELKIECVSVLEEMLEKEAEIEVFFYFQNNYHTFKSKVLRLKGSLVIIENPRVMLKNLQRKFDRIAINGKLNLKFSIKGDLIKLNYPETEITYYPTKPPFTADFYDVSISSILKKFEEKISSYITKSQIKMLRHYKPQSFEEQVVIKYGKVLYIPDTRADLPQNQIIPEFNIILKADWVKYEMLKNKTQAYLINKEISTKLKSMAENDITSEAIFPILYRNYVVGLICLFNSFLINHPITPKILNYTYNFCRVLSYILKENGYFKEEEGNIQRYMVPIFDLSPGGLSFSHDNNFFEDKLLVNNNFQFLIEMDNKPIRILAKLVRKFKNLSKYYYGFMFIDIKRNDFDYLNSYLYGDLVK